MIVEVSGRSEATTLDKELQAAKGCSKIQLSSEEDPLNWLYNTKWSRDVQETLSIGVREQKEMG